MCARHALYSTNTAAARPARAQGNTVSFVTGLTGMPALEELDLSDQKLRPGLTMEFDPTTVHGLASSLRILKALNCNLQVRCKCKCV